MEDQNSERKSSEHLSVSTSRSVSEESEPTHETNDPLSSDTDHLAIPVEVDHLAVPCSGEHSIDDGGRSEGSGDEVFQDEVGSPRKGKKWKKMAKWIQAADVLQASKSKKRSSSVP